VELADLPLPQIGPYEALVRVEACGICNSTDRKVTMDEFRPGPFPKVLGHESVGRVVELGSRVRHFASGDRVLRCVLYDQHVPGGCSRWGGMSEYAVVVDARAVAADGADAFVHRYAPFQQLVPHGLAPAEAALLIPLKEALAFLGSCGARSGGPLAIVGTGPVAQAFCFFAKGLGAGPVMVFARRAAHAGRFRALGADLFVVGDDYPTAVRERLAAGGFPLVIEAVGSPEALARCLALVSATGQVRAYGIPSLSNAWDPAQLADPRVLPVVGVAEHEVHEEMLQMVAAGRVRPGDWASHVLPVEECARAFALLEEDHAAKVVLTF